MVESRVFFHIFPSSFALIQQKPNQTKYKGLVFSPDVAFINIFITVFNNVHHYVTNKTHIRILKYLVWGKSIIFRSTRCNIMTRSLVHVTVLTSVWGRLHADMAGAPLFVRLKTFSDFCGFCLSLFLKNSPYDSIFMHMC